MVIEDREEFVDAVTRGLEVPPSYFPHNVRMNKQELESLTKVIEESLVPLSVEQVDAVLQESPLNGSHLDFEVETPITFILDVRKGELYDQEHIPGSLFIPLNSDLAIWSAYFLKPYDKVILVADNKDKVEEAVKRLARTGFEQVIGYLDGGIEAWKAAGHQVEQVDYLDFETQEDFERKTEGLALLDIRNRTEVEQGMIDAEQIAWQDMTHLRTKM